MKTTQTIYRFFPAFGILFFVFLVNVAVAQVVENPDTSKKVPADTLKAAPAAIPAEAQKTEADESDGKKKDKKGKKNEIILYGGVNFTQLSSSPANYETEAGIGYQLGGYYKQGRLLYWQAGLRYANAMISYKPAGSQAGTEFSDFQVSALDIPLTLGINFTSFMNRVLSVRLFASAMPSFTMKVGENDFDFTKDDVNSFIMYGQGGIGINVAFLVLEAGYNYGFNEMLIDKADSNPGQVFINLGFRF